MRRWGIGLALLLMASSAPKAAIAGGQLCTERESTRAERARRSWRRAGKRALPALLKAVRSRNLCLRFAAADRLRDFGLPAARALFAALRKPLPKPRIERPEAGALASVLCSALTVGKPWRRLTAKLTGAVLGKNETLAVGVLQTLGSVASSCRRRATLRPLLRSGLDVLLPVLSAKHPLCSEALRTLRAYGPAGARAAGPVGALLRTYAHRDAALDVLQAQGPAAKVAVGDLRQALRRAPPSLQARVAAVLEALGSAAVAARGDLAAVVRSVVRRKGAPRSPASAPLGAALRALAAVGGPYDAHTHVALLAVLRSDAWGISPRHEAAMALRRDPKAPLTPHDRRLLLLLARKKELRERLRPTPMQRVPPPDVQARAGLALELAICRAEAGIQGSVAPLLAGGPMPSYRHDGRVANCLAARLCGPKPAHARRAIAACCSAVYPQNAPPWCH